MALDDFDRHIKDHISDENWNQRVKYEHRDTGRNNARGKTMTFYNHWIKVQGTDADGTVVFIVKDENHNWASNKEIAEYHRRVAVANYKGPRNCSNVAQYKVIDSGVYSRDFPSAVQMEGYISDDIHSIKVGDEWLEGKLYPFPGNKVKITIEFLPDE